MMSWRSLGGCLLWGTFVAGCRSPAQDTEAVPSGDDTSALDDTGVVSDDTAPADDTGFQAQISIPDGMELWLHADIQSIVYLSWKQTVDGPSYVEYAFDPGEWHHTPATQREQGAAQAMLLGIPYDTSFRFRVVTPDGLSETGRARTGPLPTSAIEPALLVSQPDAWVESDRYLVTSINELGGGWTMGTYWKFIVDRQGRVVWALVTPDSHWTIYTRVALNGQDILWDEATFWSDWDEGAGSQVHRMKIDGTITETYLTPGLHHAFTELPDGGIVWGSATWTTEKLRQLDLDGTSRVLWDCDSFLDSVGVDDQCQSNALFWNEPTDTFLYSFYTTSTIVELDHETGETLRYWGNIPGPWSFDPAESSFWWQHGATITGDGTLLLSTYRDTSGIELVAREYEIDEDTWSLRQIWSFGEGEGVFGSTAGETHRLSNGDTLHNFGAGARVREITHDGDVVWDLAWEDGHLLGRSVFVDDLYDFAPETTSTRGAGSGALH